MSKQTPPPAASGSARSSDRALVLLWALALLCGIGNTAAYLYRTPEMIGPIDRRYERTIQDAANWLRGLPPNVRVLTLLSRKDNWADKFHYRLKHFSYPRRTDVVWDRLPAGFARRYDLLLAFDSMQTAVPSGWLPVHGSEFAELAAPAARQEELTLPPVPLPTPALPLWIRTLSGLFSLVAVLILGALLLSLTLRAPPFGAWWANLAVAHLVGAAAMTWIVSLIAFATGRLLVWPVYGVILLLIGVARPRLRLRTKIDLGRLFRMTPAEGLLAAVIALGAVGAVQRGWIIGLGWDGIAIWQFKARAFFLDGNLSMLRDTAHYGYSHLDYPLLVPLQTWWTYAHFGAISTRWAQGIGLLFTLDLLIVFAATAARSMARWAVLLGTALLATLPLIITHAVSGFADNVLAAYLLALAVFLARVLAERETSLIPLVAWMLAGTVLTKNEGLPACLVALIILLLYSSRLSKEAGSFGKVFLLWLGTTAVAYLPWFVMKHRWGLRNDVMEASVKPHLTPSLLWWRLGTTLWSGFGVEMLHVEPRLPTWGLLLLLWPLGLALTFQRRLAAAKLLWLFGALQWLGYIGVYLITPYALHWHLHSSVNRLVLQLAPVFTLAALLGCFAAENAPALNQSASVPTLEAE